MMSDWLYDSLLNKVPRRLTLIREGDADFVRQAAETTGYDIRVEDASDSLFPNDYPLAMVTHDERRELGPFWREYYYLKDKTGAPGSDAEVA